MRVKEIKEKHIWEEFLAECKEKTFMQSWNWGESHQRMGETIWRLGVYEEELEAVAQIVKTEARRGIFLTIEHGPVSRNGKRFQQLAAVLEEAKRIAKQQEAAFIRISSVWESSEENRDVFRELGFREAPTYAAAESSWKLNITPPEDELLGNMRKTTRYLIRQVLKNQDIKVIKSADKEDLEVFAALNREVSRRQQFVPFSATYLEAEFDAFSQDGQCMFLFGTYRGKVAAAAFVIFWSGIGFYHQAASQNRYAKLSIPYLVQWEAIKEAKTRGCTLYDFWGFVDPQKYPVHPWAGPTLFKMGFGGKSYQYVKTQDYPLSWKYWPTAMFEAMRTKQRGL